MEKNVNTKKIVVGIMYFCYGVLFLFLLCQINRLGIVTPDFSKKAVPLTIASILFLNFIYSLITEKAITKGVLINKRENPGMYYFMTFFWLVAAIVVLVW